MLVFGNRAKFYPNRNDRVNGLPGPVGGRAAGIQRMDQRSNNLMFKSYVHKEETEDYMLRSSSRSYYPGCGCYSCVARSMYSAISEFNKILKEHADNKKRSVVRKERGVTSFAYT